MPTLTAALLLLLQQVPPTGTGLSSPASGDTVRYWQQRADYTIAATLDEQAQRLHARAVLKYHNNSPDTLREMYVHQYLNAFRPYSKWSRADERHGIVRFQNLQDPDYGYERFTAPVRVNGSAVTVDYPGAPDSTVAHFALPAPLPPGGSIEVSFEWDARPSTVPRRQGRRGRSWDFAQWYPKVAVYDRGGWEPNALQLAGEFYGEYGDFDVTLVVAQDQVIGSTGVPVSGDPGWSRAERQTPSLPPMRLGSMAYGSVPSPAIQATAPSGFKTVRWIARNVHHFAWSTSPDYRYEGTTYVRQLPSTRWPTWDTVSIHTLYRPADDTTWGRGIVLQRTINALNWLESIYGPYAYPQMTVLHRIEGGGTEFPMMLMNGSPSQGLILHEGGHVFTYGILGNNEWRSGWMDEGFTSYQTEWAQGLAPQDRLARGITDQFRESSGYRSLGSSLRTSRADAINLQDALADIAGETQPIGTTAHEFRDFSTYNNMIYTRGQIMYSQLRDELGDSLWREFLHDYYSRWALRHVDERAMRASAERVSGRDLSWFFRQWVHETGVLDYALTDVSKSTGTGGWITEATVRRRGEYAHSMNVGVRTRSGWTLARIPDPQADVQTVRIVTGEEPLEVRLDPYHFTWDWDRRNDVRGNRPNVNFDWPLLSQMDREHSMLLFRPTAWYSDPGGATIGIRARSTYLQTLDRSMLGVAVPVKGDLPEHVQLWARTTNPYLPFMSRPAYGFSAGAALLDDIVEADLGWTRERSVARRDFRDRWALTYTYGGAFDGELLPEGWQNESVIDLSGSASVRDNKTGGGYRFASARGLGGYWKGGFAKGELALGDVYALSRRTTLGLRAYAGGTVGDEPAQRALYLSAADPVETFGNHWWRPRGSILKQGGSVSWLPLGGAALRGYDWRIASEGVAAANVEFSQRIGSHRSETHSLELRVQAFGDGALTSEELIGDDGALMDAGVGIAIRGRIYDLPINLRIDSPFYVSAPALAFDGGRAGSGKLAPRWAISFSDIW